MIGTAVFLVGSEAADAAGSAPLSLFKFTQRVHPKFRSPSGGLLFVGGISALFALSGTYAELYSLVVFALWIFLTLAIIALIRLRKVEPALPRPYSTTMTVKLWLDRPVRCSIGLAIMLLGLPFYFHWRKKSDLAVSGETTV